MKVLIDSGGILWGSFETKIYVQSLLDELFRLSQGVKLEVTKPAGCLPFYKRALASKLKGSDYALFHALGSIIPKGFEGATLLSLADISSLIYPKEAGRFGATFRRCLKSSAVLAKRIIVPSSLVKRGFLKFFKYPSKWIDVYPAGEWPIIEKVDDKKTLEQWRSELALSENLALCACESKSYKNWEGLISAFSSVRAKDSLDWSLAIAFFDHIPKALISKTMPSWLKVFKASEQDTLKKLYNLANVFMYPSLYDGFPYPLISAMKLEIPSLASITSSTREFVKRGALLVDARSHLNLQRGIRKLLNDEALRSELMRLGKKEVSEFSWSHLASATLDVYKKLAGVKRL